MVLTRRTDQWHERTVGASAGLTTPLLPDFALSLTDVFAAAGLASPREPNGPVA